MKTITEVDKRIPRSLAYTKYYEHDGMLRAYANRAMFLAMLFRRDRLAGRWDLRSTSVSSRLRSSEWTKMERQP